jgi:hypothetical protein
MAMLASEIAGISAESLGRRLGRFVALAIVVVVLVTTTAEQFGLPDVDRQSIEEFVMRRSELATQGGSRIAPASLSGLAGVPLAFANVLFRPHPFEAGSPQLVFSSLEIWMLWLFTWRRRGQVLGSLRSARSDRVLRFALAMTVLHTLMIGWTFGNLGLIARQRVPVMPFALLFLAGAGAVRLRETASQESAASAPERPWRVVRRGEPAAVYVQEQQLQQRQSPSHGRVVRLPVPRA